MGPRSRPPPLTLVDRRDEDAAARDVDWSILMARAQAGDGAAYRRLLEDITPYVRARARHYHGDPDDVEDAVQDVLLTVHAVRRAYDPLRPFGPWLVAIAHRRFVDRLRRQGRTRSREAALTADHDAVPAPEANVDEMWDRRALTAAVERLPPGQRRAIRLLKLEAMSLKEAARESGMSVASLKVATHRAIKNLRKILGQRSDT